MTQPERSSKWKDRLATGGAVGIALGLIILAGGIMNAAHNMSNPIDEPFEVCVHVCSEDKYFRPEEKLSCIEQCVEYEKISADGLK